MLELPFKLGIHPINWVGEDVKEHGESTTFEQIVDDIQALGLTGTEMGRKYPADPQVLKKALSAHGIQLVSQWKSVLFSDPAYRDQELRAYRAHAEFLSAMGASVISTCEVGGSLHFDPRRTPHEKEVLRLDDTAWHHLADGLNAAGAIAQEYGLKLTYHHHGGTAVEQPDEIDRLMAMTEPSLVYLLYDTGHAYYGGADPVAVLRKHYDRIAYIHLKDIRQDVLDSARADKADFITCIRKGVFTVPGDGCLDFAPIIQELLSRGYSGWTMIEGEQDPQLHPPYDYAKRSLEYIESLIHTERR
ncbi:myo-inosose-2 dehydratase [Paenibacillus xerothermodurans]|uniref:Myo-inosose-2 dehydratase n=1 Tax=Paenibacillus xerothermodurans TaxID=1977292 RepID=A0A2W1NCH4_PAEXE|nr:myo-inosose-2 dehydratase [Paenibacillus xerothermodurans]PZE21664.1 myo-inosose-2 dehydratase [Paenibacillus xerothermodurans]